VHGADIAAPGLHQESALPAVSIMTQTNRRLLHMIPSMGGGGAERQLTYLARGQIANGWDVHAAMLEGGPYQGKLSEAGAVIHLIETSGKYDPLLLQCLVSLIGRVRPAIVHTRLMKMDLLGGAAALLRGVPWLLSERSSAALYVPTWKHRFRVLLARGASAIDANSAAGAAYWAKVLPGVPCQVIPGALPFEEIDAAPPADLRKLGLSEGVAVILFAGRIDSGKNISVLLAALQRVFRERDAVAVICGRGPLEDEARRITSMTGIEGRVHFQGFTSEIWSWMKAADVLVSPSLFEGRPNVIMEAAACFCPLVVSDIPEHREFLDEDCALFVPPGDVEAITAALLATIDDRAAARGRAIRAAHAVSGFTIPRVVSQLDRLYADVLQGKARSR
jgi:glycosyltransferase involved in cell wall biosynthesis